MIFVEGKVIKVFLIVMRSLYSLHWSIFLCAPPIYLWEEWSYVLVNKAASSSVSDLLSVEWESEEYGSKSLSFTLSSQLKSAIKKILKSHLS